MGKAEDLAKTKMKIAQRGFTRQKALNSITKDNCGEEKYTKHPNRHVKDRAAYLAANPSPAAEENTEAPTEE